MRWPISVAVSPVTVGRHCTVSAQEAATAQGGTLGQREQDITKLCGLVGAATYRCDAACFAPGSAAAVGLAWYAGQLMTAHDDGVSLREVAACLVHERDCLHVPLSCARIPALRVNSRNVPS